MMPFCSFPKRRGDMLVAVASTPRASPLPTRPHKTWSFLGLPGCDTPPPEHLLSQFFPEYHSADSFRDEIRKAEESDSSQDESFSEEEEEKARIPVESQLFPSPLPIPTVILKSNRTPPPPHPQSQQEQHHHACPSSLFSSNNSNASRSSSISSISSLTGPSSPKILFPNRTLVTRHHRPHRRSHLHGTSRRRRTALP